MGVGRGGGGYSEVISLLAISLHSQISSPLPASVELTSPILIEGEISEPLLSEVVIWIMTNLLLT